MLGAGRAGRARGAALRAAGAQCVRAPSPDPARRAVHSATPSRPQVDEEKARLMLSNKRVAADERVSSFKVGDVVEGTVMSVKPYGAFVEIGGASGLLHISQVRGRAAAACMRGFVGRQRAPMSRCGSAHPPLPTPAHLPPSSLSPHRSRTTASPTWRRC